MKNKMNNKILASIFDREIELRERIIRVIILLGSVIAVAGIVESFFISDMRTMLLPLFILLIAIVIAGVATFRFRRVNFSAIIIGLMLILIVFPDIFFTNGGISGGATVWFVIGIFYCFLIFSGWQLAAFLILDVIVVTVTYTVGYLRPDLIINFSSTMDVYIDSVFSVLIVGFTCGLLYRFQKAVAQNEQDIVEKQNHELEEIAQSRSKFFTNMSHEFRTPLNTIVGLNEMIARESNQAEISEYASHVSSASKLLISLVNDIIDLSKMEMQKMDIIPVEYDTSAMIKELVDVIGVQMENKHLTFNLEIDENLPSVLYGDERHIKQVMLNLLNNAVKYTEKGSVTLSVYSEKIDDETILLRMSVIDTGMGIRKEDMESLYDIFKRVDAVKNINVQGSGLGLTITKQLVTLMGGEVTVDSIYTKGSTFSIKLNQKIVDATPIDDALSVTSGIGIVDKYQPSFEAPEARVLVVDDSRLNARIVSLLLEKTGMQIDVATSGEECLQMTKTKSYHVILMDYQMADMNGAEALAKVRRQENGLCRNSVVLVLTANSLADTIRICKENNFDGYVEKPIQPDKLESEILKFLPEELIEHRSGEIVENGNIVTNQRRSYKKKIMVTTDCVCDLPKELLDKYDIRLMHLYIQTPNGRFADTKEIDSDNLTQYVQNGKITAKAVSVTVEEYEQFFANALTGAEQVVHISMAKDSGKSYGIAQQAAKCFENVRVIDSTRISGGQGMLALYAAKMVGEGRSLDEICQEINRIKGNIVTRFLIPSADSFYDNGYMSGFAAQLCGRMRLRPILGFKQSRLCAVGFERGPLEVCWKKFIRKTLRKKERINTDIVIITHAGCTVQQLEYIKQEILKLVPFERIIVQKASFSNSANAGVYSVGISFYMKENIIF